MQDSTLKNLRKNRFLHYSYGKVKFNIFSHHRIQKALFIRYLIHQILLKILMQESYESYKVEFSTIFVLLAFF